VTLTAQILTADTMARVGASLEQLHRNPEPTQAQAKGKAGKTSPDHLDGFHELLVAEKKWVKGPAVFSFKIQPGTEGQRALNSFPLKPAFTLTRASCRVTE